MKKFQVNMTQTKRGFIQIDAENESEARDRALSGDEEINWTDDEIELDYIEEIK